MAIRVLTARRRQFPEARLMFVIHVDTTKMDPLIPANPDPRWLMTVERMVPPSWQARSAADRNAFLAALRDELLAMAQRRASELSEEDAGGNVIASLEGQVIG